MDLDLIIRCVLAAAPALQGSRKLWNLRRRTPDVDVAALRERTDRLIAEHDEVIRRALRLATFWSPADQRYHDVLDETYIGFTTENLEHPDRISRCTVGRLREVLHEKVFAAFAVEYAAAVARKEYRTEAPVVDFASLSPLDVEEIAATLPGPERLRFVAAFQYSREQVTTELAWIFRP